METDSGRGTESSISSGLKFGQKIYFEDSGGGGGSGPGSSSGSGRRTRGGGSGLAGQTPRCQVEGCGVDLSNVKAYYSRHKVCAVHSKSPKVIVAGLEQRFCQQCSRFHQLPEFDQEKRSCRRRLAGHNERRRKPQPPSLLTSRYGRISSSLLGNATTAMSGSFLADPMAWPPPRASAGSAMSRPLSSPTWRINHETHPLNTFPQGSCSAAESCAHSFLSNQQHQTSHSWQVSSGFNLMTVDGVSVPQPGTASSHHQYPNPPWDLKGGENISGSSHNMPPVLGLGRISEATNPQTGSRAAMGGFEFSQNPHTRRLYMEPENQGTFDSSPQNINWHL